MAAISSIIGVAALGVSAAGAISSSKASSKANKTAQQAQQSQEQIMNRQQDIADEQWENYKTNYLPMEHEYLETAKNFGSIANQEKAAANSAAANQGAFANARDELNRSPGLDPNSQQFLRTKAKLETAEAASSAAGQTASREGVQKTGAAMLQDAASMGKGMSGSAVASLNAAGAGATQFAGMSQANANNAGARAGQTMAGLGQMAGGMYKSGAFDGIGNAIQGKVDMYSGGGFGTGNSYGNQDLGAFV